MPVQLLSTRVPNLDWIFNEPCYCLTLNGIVCLLLDCLTCVPNLDWISFDFCHCPTLIGIVYLLLDCYSVYQNHSVKAILYHLCLRVEHLSLTHLSTLQADHERSSDKWAPRNLKVWTLSTQSPLTWSGAWVYTPPPVVQNELFCFFCGVQ